MAIKHLVAVLAVASLAVLATDADAKGFKVKSKSSSSPSTASSSATTKKAARDEEPAFSSENIKKTKASEREAGSVPSVSISPRLNSSSSPARAAGANTAVPIPVAAAAPVAAPAVDDEAKRKRAEELAALQRKFDEETKARQAEEQRRKAAEAEAERKVREQQEEQRRAAEARQREARRALHAATPPACVIKPAMSDDDLAKCRGR